MNLQRRSSKVWRKRLITIAPSPHIEKLHDNVGHVVIAPHPDDAELGMGGGIAKMIASGMRVGVLDLTSGEPTPHGSEELRKQETAAASQALGLTWRENLGLRNRYLEATLEARATACRRLSPCASAVAVCSLLEDAHPDHVAATQLVEALRASGPS